MSDPDRVFSRRTLIMLAAVGGIAALASFVMNVFGDGLGRQTTIPSAFSRSAIGYGSLVDLLRGGGFPVVVSTSETERKAGPGSLLVLAEPIAGQQTDAILDRLLAAPNVLLILPKWSGEAWHGNGRWIGDVRRIDPRRAEAILRRIDPNATVVANPGGPELSSTLGAVALDEPQYLRSNTIGTSVSAGGNVLVGSYQRGRQRIWVLADPDVLNNHGIDNGAATEDGLPANTRFAFNLFGTAVPEGGSIVFDETVHGFIDGDALWRAALRPPFLVPTLVLGLTLLVLLWAGIGRVGRPLSEGRAIPVGHAALIDSTAELLVMGGPSRYLLRDYLEQTAQQVAKALHVKPTYNAALIDRLDEIAAQRGVKQRHRDLAERVEAFVMGKQPASARALTLDILRWKKEMTDGS